MWDLESAWGRYSDPGPVEDDVNYWQGVNADPVAGYDNHDVWPVEPDSLRYSEEIRNYAGSVKDFFSLSRGTGEFSCLTNPNTFGQSTISRRAPQIMENSMSVKIVEELESSAIVNIVVLAKNPVMSPSAGDICYVGDSVNITWSHYCDELLQNSCRIEFSPDSGPLPVFQEVARGVSVAGGKYVWTPSESDMTQTGRIRVYYTTVAGESSYEESGVFSVVAPPVVFADKSADTQLSYEGQPYSTAALDYDGSGPLDMFIDFGPTYWGRLFKSDELDLNSHVPVFINATSSAFSGSAPSSGMLGIAVADYDNDGHEDFFVASENNPRLYHYNTATEQYDDFTSSTGLASYASGSITGAWGDYDRDGWVDLFIARGQGMSPNPVSGYWSLSQALPDYLLRNDMLWGTGFEDVSAQAGISPSFYTYSTSASWGDFNGDQWPDLFVGCSEEPTLGDPTRQSTLYIQSNGVFANQFETLIGSQASYGVNGVTWADMDNDGNLDIVTSNHFGHCAVFYSTDQGTLRERQAFQNLDYVGGHSVFDADLDGRFDLLYYPAVDSENLVLLKNETQNQTIEFVDRTVAYGLNSPGTTGGVIATDFNNDGDNDLLLGRRAVANADSALYGNLFFRATQFGETVDSPASNWLSVRLSSPHGFNNSEGIGARVTVYANGNQYVRLGDGGHGRGESSGPAMLFGLGTASVVDSVTVDWPRGTHQVLTSVSANQQLLIEDSTTVEVVELGAYYQVVPGTNLLDYTFRWKTTVWTTDSLDAVELQGTNGCSVALTTITPSSQNVEHSVSYSGGHYLHNLVWRNQLCTAGCDILYRAKSEVTGVASDWSDQNTLSVTVCGKKYIPSN